MEMSTVGFRLPRRREVVEESGSIERQYASATPRESSALVKEAMSVSGPVSTQAIRSLRRMPHISNSLATKSVSDASSASVITLRFLGPVVPEEVSMSTMR